MAQYSGLLDMFDGGGAGVSGVQFEGGLLSELLNALGIRPMGSGAAGQPAVQAAPAAVAQASAQPAQATMPASSQPRAATPPSPLPSLLETSRSRDAEQQAANGAWLDRAMSGQQAWQMPSLLDVVAGRGDDMQASNGAWLDFAMQNPLGTGNADLSAAWQAAMKKQPTARSPHPLASLGF